MLIKGFENCREPTQKQILGYCSSDKNFRHPLMELTLKLLDREAVYVNSASKMTGEDACTPRPYLG